MPPTEEQQLMAGTSTVACFGSRELLSLFVAAAPYPDSLMGLSPQKRKP
jgi:hypothetical protein